MSSLMSFLTSIPRATQLDKDPKHAILVNTLEHELRYYLHQVHRHTFRQDKRYKTDRRTLVRMHIAIKNTSSYLSFLEIMIVKSVMVMFCFFFRDPELTFFDQMEQPMMMYRYED